ncbi:thymidine kinase [Bifidobacterium sp. BRDM6]|uniref:Thymidine kinase n=2 Tax=Bifidobacterium choloepi TaxID=2614131 RepID=A0A6I5N159_9BIFI|nr:thymidine kinase [Bifidobacterium choloepi]
MAAYEAEVDGGVVTGDGAVAGDVAATGDGAMVGDGAVAGDVATDGVTGGAVDDGARARETRKPLDFDAVIVDEAQFLTAEQVDALARIVDEFDIPVMCYGLRTDFRGVGFEGSTRLLLIADKIEAIKTVCWCGKAACFNARLDADGHVMREGDQILLGGNGTYISLCRKHYYAGLASRPE